MLSCTMRLSALGHYLCLAAVYTLLLILLKDYMLSDPIDTSILYMLRYCHNSKSSSTKVLC